MFLKNMKIAYLLDFYGEALDPHTLSVMRAYYNDDLSLSEIASGEEISRQGIRHLIKKGEEQLEFFESKFALAERFEELRDAARSLTEIKNSLSQRPENKGECEKLSEIIGIILKGAQ